MAIWADSLHRFSEEQVDLALSRFEPLRMKDFQASATRGSVVRSTKIA
jgi:hypothetical protein